VWRNESPCPSWPESNGAVFEVTVCATGSAFVQQIVVPAGTCSADGEYEKPLIEIGVSPGSHGATCASAPSTLSAAASAQHTVRAAKAFIGA
jgi:hypothetical protein